MALSDWRSYFRDAASVSITLVVFFFLILFSPFAWWICTSSSGMIPEKHCVSYIWLKYIAVFRSLKCRTSTSVCVWVRVRVLNAHITVCVRVRAVT